MATAGSATDLVRFDITTEINDGETTLFLAFEDESAAIEFVSVVQRQDGGEAQRTGLRVSLPVPGFVSSFVGEKSQYIVEFESREAAERWHKYSIISFPVSSKQLYIPRTWNKNGFTACLQASSAPKSKKWLQRFLQH